MSPENTGLGEGKCGQQVRVFTLKRPSCHVVPECLKHRRARSSPHKKKKNAGNMKDSLANCSSNLSLFFPICGHAENPETVLSQSLFILPVTHS